MGWNAKNEPGIHVLGQSRFLIPIAQSQSKPMIAEITAMINATPTISQIHWCLILERIQISVGASFSGFKTEVPAGNLYAQ